MNPAIVPSRIEQSGPDTLKIVWSDGHECRYPVRRLRLACRCANCIGEWSGEALIDPQSIPSDVRPAQIRPVGRYALQIDWTDGHNTGLYTFALLRELCADWESTGLR